MRHVSLDIETYSAADLSAVGTYRYSEDPSFEVLLLAYAVGEGPVRVVDVVRDGLPGHVADMLVDPGTVKHAFNASFERVCLSRLLLPPGAFLDPAQWACTMVQAAYWGVPGSLKQVAEVLGLSERKDAAGKRLIRTFSLPEADGEARAREGEDWEAFKAYCAQDVAVEREVQRAVAGELPARERGAWAADQRINDRGAGIDGELARAARRMSVEGARRTAAYLARATGLDNPGSVAQLKGWLAQHGCPVASVGREALEAALARGGMPEATEAVVRARLASARSSVKKYDAAVEAACADGRLRGCFQFYGAQTGRWAGRLMQLQNLPRGDLRGDALDDARALVRAGDAEAVDLLYGNVPDVLKSLVRTVVMPPPGRLLAVADYSAIEARVIAWLAGEEAVLEVFRTTGRIYEAIAARMFGVPVEAVDKAMRQRGKVATLALGYGGGTAALERMGALRMGLAEDELPGLVRAWRGANRRIVGLWREVEAAARACAHGERAAVPVASGRVTVRHEPAVRGLAIDLPSGRALHYRRARADGDGLTYLLSGRGAGVVQVRTYGGRLVENVVQAVARDLLACALVRLDAAGERVVAHVHDEIVAEVAREEAEQGLARLRRAMCAAPDWADGLPLAADGYLCENYRKD